MSDKKDFDYQKYVDGKLIELSESKLKAEEDLRKAQAYVDAKVGELNSIIGAFNEFSKMKSEFSSNIPIPDKVDSKI